MLRKFFDLNRTVKHVSYKEAKRQFERDRRRSDLFFKAVLIVAMVAMFLMWIASLLFG
jgi:hypothetical protein